VIGFRQAERTDASRRSPGSQEFRVRLGTTSFDRFVLYAAFIACLAGTCVHSARLVAAQSMALAAPHVAGWRQAELSRAELRSVEVASATSEPPAITRGPVFPDEPPLTLKQLVVQLDSAERIDLVGRERRSRKGRALVMADANPRHLPAADVFGEGFGVLLKASR
jgi:hypothetical protein